MRQPPPERRRPALLGAILGFALILAAIGRCRRLNSDPEPRDPTAPIAVRPGPGPDLTPWLWLALACALAAIIYAAVKAGRK